MITTQYEYDLYMIEYHNITNVHCHETVVHSQCQSFKAKLPLPLPINATFSFTLNL